MVQIPTVSVIMITYGHEKYISDAINGVFMQQTDFPIELIISNDCSPDSTNEIIENLLCKVPANLTVKYTKHVKNLGMMPNFIWTLKQARGKFIAICEGDDYWIDPLKIQKQVDFSYKYPQCVFFFTGANFINKEKNGVYFKHKNFVTGVVPKINFMEKGGGDFCTATVLFKQDIIEPIPNYLANASVGDFPLGLLAISKGEIGYLEDITTMYRQNSEGSWTSKQSHQIHREQYFAGIELIKEFNKETNFQYNHITEYYLNEYRFNYIYREIIENNFFKSIFIIIENFSINRQKNIQLLKTFLWKLKNRKNIF